MHLVYRPILSLIKIQDKIFPGKILSFARVRASIQKINSSKLELLRVLNSIVFLIHLIKHIIMYRAVQDWKFSMFTTRDKDFTPRQKKQ